jgi:hypothetical protein
MISQWKGLFETVAETERMSDNCDDVTFYLRLLTSTGCSSRENVSAKGDKMSFTNETVAASAGSMLRYIDVASVHARVRVSVVFKPVQSRNARALLVDDRIGSFVLHDR